MLQSISSQEVRQTVPREALVAIKGDTKGRDISSVKIKHGIFLLVKTDLKANFCMYCRGSNSCKTAPL